LSVNPQDFFMIAKCSIVELSKVKMLEAGPHSFLIDWGRASIIFPVAFFDLQYPTAGILLTKFLHDGDSSMRQVSHLIELLLIPYASD